MIGTGDRSLCWTHRSNQSVPGWRIKRALSPYTIRKACNTIVSTCLESASLTACLHRLWRKKASTKIYIIGLSLTRGKHLHERITSTRGEGGRIGSLRITSLRGEGGRLGSLRITSLRGEGGRLGSLRTTSLRGEGGGLGSLRITSLRGEGGGSLNVV
jgi:hypothetical protein